MRRWTLLLGSWELSSSSQSRKHRRGARTWYRAVHVDCAGNPVKICKREAKLRPLGDFYVDAKGPQASCKYCVRAAARALYAKDVDSSRRRVRDYQFRAKFGIGVDEYEKRREGASHCAICGSAGTLNLDHDHATGAIREWLCPPCNKGLGHFGDSPSRLHLAVQYLERHGKRE